MGLSIIAATIAFGAKNSYTTEFLDTAANDLSNIHTVFKQKTDVLLNSDEDLQEYSKKVESLESKISAFLENKIDEFSSKDIRIGNDSNSVRANIRQADDNGSSKSQTDLAKEIPDEIIAQNATAVNVNVIKTQDEMMGTLLDIKA